MEIRELTTIEEMLAQFALMTQLYPNLDLAKYKDMLEQMLPHNYTQIGVFENGTCLGITGCWIATKLWTGKYLEIDNFIVDTTHRSKGVGKLLTDYIAEKAKAEGCSTIVLDAFTTNFAAHRFYYNQGYNPKGFHFVKILEENALT